MNKIIILLLCIETISLGIYIIKGQIDQSIITGILLIAFAGFSAIGTILSKKISWFKGG